MKRILARSHYLSVCRCWSWACAIGPMPTAARPVTTLPAPAASVCKSATDQPDRESPEKSSPLERTGPARGWRAPPEMNGGIGMNENGSAWRLSMPRRWMNCFYCMSFWIALPLAVLTSNGWLGIAAHWLALSSAAGLLGKSTTMPGPEFQRVEIPEGDAPCVAARHEAV